MFETYNKSVEESIILKGANFITTNDINYIINTGNEEDNYYSHRHKHTNNDNKLFYKTTPFKLCLSKQFYVSEKGENSGIMLCVQYENIITGKSNESANICVDLFVNNIKNYVPINLLR